MAATSTSVLLPHDILRLIVEQASLTSNASALTLARVSRTVQAWSELIIYSQITLHDPSTTLSFLRTIHTCPMKPPHFFARAVKSLCLSYDDVYEDRMAQIIAACPGVMNLTFWVVPHMTTSRRQCFGAIASTGNSASSSLTTALSVLRPKKLSVHLAGLTSSLFSLGSPATSPAPAPSTPWSQSQSQLHPSGPSHPANKDFFNHVTHLSVIDRWEAWVNWKGFELLPCLTHISLDVSVGVGQGLNLYLTGEDGYHPQYDFDYAGGIRPVAFTTTHHDHHHRSTKAAYTIGRGLAQNVLSKSSTLRVCVVLIMFDSSPGVTAKAILDGVMSLGPSSLGVTAAHVARDVRSNTNATTPTTTRNSKTVVVPTSSSSHAHPDPRLVFIHDAEPFLDREAHSNRETRVWEMAEGIVCAQGVGERV